MAPLPPADQRHPWLGMSDTVMDLDTADTLSFQLGGVRRRMTWRRFILALGLHTEQEMAEAGGQGLNKVTSVDLFYLCSMDRGTTNVSYLLAQYLFHHAEGRKSGARLFRGHFIRRLEAHFGLQAATGGAHEGDEGGPTVEEAAQDIPTPVQGPQPHLPAPQARTMSQKIKRTKEEMRDLR
nr:hypothetical protein [Tanacetum cinerariifolium]